MKCRFIMGIGFIFSAFLLGCVSQNQFNTVNSDYLLAQQQLLKSKNKLEECRNTLEESEKKIDQCGQDQARASNHNILLSQKIEALSQSIKKKETVISLQETVIRLFDDSKQTLQASIHEQIEAQGLELTTSLPPMKFVLVSKLLFQSGNANLSTEGKTLLKKLTGLLQDEQYPYIQIHGHTDDRRLKSNALYATNWELSVARAATVARFLHETVGLKPERISATGFGEYRPIAPNETDEGRRQNRRIEIILETVQPTVWVEETDKIK